MSNLLQYSGNAFAPFSSDADITGGNLTKASLTNFYLHATLGYITDPVYQGFPASGATAQSTAVTNNSYFSFAVTVSSGKKMSLTSLTFKAARGGTSTPRGWGLRSSIDSYGNDIATSTIATVRTTWTDYSVDLSGAPFQNLTGTTTFRFYVWTTSTTGSIECDEIILNGLISAVGTPDTSRFFLLF